MELEHTPFHPSLMGDMSLENARVEDREEQANNQRFSRNMNRSVCVCVRALMCACVRMCECARTRVGECMCACV